MKIISKAFRIAVISALVLNSAGAADKSDKAMQLANEWQDKSGTAIRGPDGRIMFVYGDSQPRLVCGLFLMCDIAMERGEIINVVRIGDSTRWVLSPARVGEGDSFVEHILVKPSEAGLNTNLFVATNRRSYMISLVSSEKDNMGEVGFLYGNSNWSNSTISSNSGVAVSGNTNNIETQQMGDMSLLPRPVGEQRGVQVITVDPTPVGEEVVGEDLNFNYHISPSDVAWRPIRAYDDGERSYIDLDRRKVGANKLPVFLINDTDSRGEMVVYRYDSQRSRFIIDALFEKGTLMLGKGRTKKKVIIKRDDLDQAASRW
ncbi:TrbG/VirB9 family P-type conjugative transfer protein [Maritalea sp.]|uniref:TrbG/VirB9 family P-type conjugative transfer protein n=1 Tax=Maritalea sp. TaxID=2003361 RepID=UPI003EF592D8